MKAIVLTLVLTALALALPSCTTQASGGGTCESTCAKADELDCLNSVHDLAGCIADCKQWQSECSEHAKAFQNYLDCEEEAEWTCNYLTDTPSAVGCAVQGTLLGMACPFGGK